MKKRAVFLIIFALLILTNSPAPAVCPEGSNWTAAWTDKYGQTTYNLEAPCKVYIGIPFTVTATVTDSVYPNSSVALNWAIKDNGSVIAGGGFNWLDTVNGQWQRTLEQTYTGTPVDHTIEFQFSDLGQGSGAHYWTAKLVGDLTVDPYPPVKNNAPVADAGPDLFMQGKDRDSAVVAGTASDPDGDALTYRWLEGPVELQAPEPVGSSGSAPLVLAATAPLSLGAHLLTLEVSDGTGTATDTVVLSIENSEPVAAPSCAGTYQLGTDLDLRGSVADYDGDSLEYRWKEGDVVLRAGSVQATAGGAPVGLPEQAIPGGLSLGSHLLVLEVSDGIHTVNAEVAIAVIDTTAPVLAPASSADILWPPTGKMTPVTITANARDNSGQPPMLSVLITSSQPPKKDKQGKIVPDWSGLTIDQSRGTISVQLRNASGNEKGRLVYTMDISAEDGSGNRSSSQVVIKALHDRGRHQGQNLR